MKRSIVYVLFLSIAAPFFGGGYFVFQYFFSSSPEEPIESHPSFSAKTSFKSVPLLIGTTAIEVEIADTPAKQIQGLSKRQSMPEDRGMLFVYQKPGRYAFWMKEMKFPLDFLWIDEEYTIVEISRNISPDTYPQVFQPKSPVQYVLEVNAGWAERKNISLGEKIVFLENEKLEFVKQREDDPQEALPGKDPKEDSFQEQSVLFDVPFTPQAPFGDWEDERQQNACEEAAALMAMRWVEGRELSRKEAEEEIIAISEYERWKYGHFHDTSAKDVVERIFQGYFQYENVEVFFGISSQDILQELLRGNIVIVPVNGQKLKNPYFTPPGPIEHMLLIRGYDAEKKEFITNDPGTRRGEGYRYPQDVLEGALQDYPTGYHLPIQKRERAMIVVRPDGEHKD